MPRSFTDQLHVAPTSCGTPGTQPVPAPPCRKPHRRPRLHFAEAACQHAALPGCRPTRPHREPPRCELPHREPVLVELRLAAKPPAPSASQSNVPGRKRSQAFRNTAEPFVLFEREESGPVGHLRPPGRFPYRHPACESALQPRRDREKPSYVHVLPQESSMRTKAREGQNLKLQVKRERENGCSESAAVNS